MKSKKIKPINNNVGAGNSLLVRASEFNDAVADIDFLYPVHDQLFRGEIDLTRSLTHYRTITVNATLAVTASTFKSYSASAEIRMIGDGATTPTFSSDFTISASSDAYDTTLAAINKIVFYYDGDTTFYSITVL